MISKQQYINIDALIPMNVSFNRGFCNASQSYGRMGFRLYIYRVERLQSSPPTPPDGEKLMSLSKRGMVVFTHNDIICVYYDRGDVTSS
jgi:hypothetical protein